MSESAPSPTFSEARFAPVRAADAAIRISDLLGAATRQEPLDWKPFFPGVEIFRIYGDGRIGPSAALLRFEPGGEVPAHEHVGFEHIFVLSGSQHDQNGRASAGTLIVNSPGTTHSITSETGCIVLAIYEKPVRFADNGAVSNE